ncbi:MAG: undecaprenyl-diphosphatase UppP [Anaerolineae bacterium]
MTTWQAILLGILQGLTEFLPVSSSGHLVIVPYLLGWPDPGLAVDAMLHLGTLLAIVVFFWADIWRLVKAAVVSLQRRSLADPDSRIAWGLVVATIPGALLGFFFEDLFERLFGMPRAAAAFLLVTALLLILSEVMSKRFRPIAALSWLDALLIGLAQSLAIAPGISRSGSTIAAGMLLGFHREEAARFSFLLAIPITFGSGAFQLLKLLTGTPVMAAPAVVLSGMVAAAVAGYLAIAALLALVRRQSLLVFAVYCGVLGLAVLTGLLG